MAPPQSLPLLVTTIGDVVDTIGSSRPFHRMLTFMVGLMFGAEVMELFLVTYLTAQLQSEFGGGASTGAVHSDTPSSSSFSFSSDDTTPMMEEASAAFVLSTLATAVFFGMLLGSLSSGPLSDRRGRQPAAVLYIGIGAAAGMASAWSPTFYYLLFFRFLVGFGAGGGHIASTILLEMVPTKSRGFHISVSLSIWSLGTMLQCVVAYYLLVVCGYSWRVFVFVSALPMAMLTLAAYKIMPESPRWLLLHAGRTRGITTVSSSGGSGGADGKGINNNSAGGVPSAAADEEEEAIRVLRWIHRFMVSPADLASEHQKLLQQHKEQEGRPSWNNNKNNNNSNSRSGGTMVTLSPPRSPLEAPPSTPEVDLTPILEVLFGDYTEGGGELLQGQPRPPLAPTAGGGGSRSPHTGGRYSSWKPKVILFGAASELESYVSSLLEEEEGIRNGRSSGGDGVNDEEAPPTFIVDEDADEEEEKKKKKKAGNNKCKDEMVTASSDSNSALSFPQMLQLVLGAKYRRMTLSFWLVWSMVSASYYGLSMLTTSAYLENSAYLSIFVAGAGELPSYPLLWWAPAKYGRRRCLQVPALICILLLISWGLLSNFGEEVAQEEGEKGLSSGGGTSDGGFTIDIKASLGAIIVGLLRMFLLFMFNVVFIYSPESYPLHIRTSATGLCSAASRVAAALVPMVAFPLKVVAGPLATYAFFATLFYLLFVGASFIPYDTTSVDIDDEDGKRRKLEVSRESK